MFAQYFCFHINIDTKAKKKRNGIVELTGLGLASSEGITYETRFTATDWGVIDNTTTGIVTARTWTRIFASLIDTRLWWRAFWIDCTFWVTVRWLSKEIGQARTSRTFTDNATLWVGAAWWWNTRIFRNFGYVSNDWRTSYKWITSKSFWTRTNRVVIDDLTFGVISTSAGARINAFLIQTGFVQITFSANNTFRSTWWRSTDHSWQTCTRSGSIIDSTHCVGSTRWRITRIFWWFGWLWSAWNKWITNIAGWTRTSWYMIDYITICIWTTSSNTRIYAT